MAEQLKLIDGQAVDIRLVRMTGTVDVDDEDLSDVKFGKSLVMVVIGKVGAGGHKETRTGDVQYTDIITAQVMRVATGELKDQLLQALGFTFQDELELPPTLSSPALPSSNGTAPKATAPLDAEEEPEDPFEEERLHDHGEDLLAEVEPEVEKPSWKPVSVPNPKDPALASFINEATG